MDSTINRIFNPDSIPAEYMSKLRVEIMQDMVRDGANEASVKLQSEIMAAEKVDPVLQFCMKLIVETWLISHGYRMIQDASINSSIRKQLEEQNRRKNAGVFAKIGDILSGKSEKTRTELIEQNEALAAINESLKNDNAKLELDKVEARRQATEIVIQASQSASEITSLSTKTADDLLFKTRREVARLVREAEDEVSSKKLIISRLQSEIRQKRQIAGEFDANLDVVEVFNRINAMSEQQIRDEILDQIDSIKFELQKVINSKERSITFRREVVCTILDGYGKYVLGNLDKYETQFGPEKRSLLMPCIIMELTKAIKDNRNIDLINITPGYYPGTDVSFSVSFFGRFLRPLVATEHPLQNLVTDFDETFRSFIIAKGDLSDIAIKKMLKRSLEISKPSDK